MGILKQVLTGLVITLFLAACVNSNNNQQTLTDEALLDTVQTYTVRYFYDFAHPICGMAVERSDERHYSNDIVTTGGTGFGIMAVIASVERKFIPREEAVVQLLKIVNFLDTCERFHGAWSHWYFGSTGKTKAFSEKDNGGDLVETSFLMQGLLAARQYFTYNNENEMLLTQKINKLWNEVNWNWYTNQQDVLYWHWSPNFKWAMNHEIKGWDECLITYVLAASSPTHSITAEVYHKGWTNSSHFINDSVYYGIKLPLGFPYGGPLFFSHYSFLGLNPHGLSDQYANYWEQNTAQTLINYKYCVDNPKNYKGYSQDCWGLSASDDYQGYSAHSPTNDLGVITPTAALSSFPYTPKESMRALHFFYSKMGYKIWGKYGFTDAFSLEKDWYADNYLAIDQGPIVVMIENYRSGLLWDLFMSCPEVQVGLKKLGFTINN